MSPFLDAMQVVTGKKAFLVEELPIPKVVYLEPVGGNSLILLSLLPAPSVIKSTVRHFNATWGTADASAKRISWASSRQYRRQVAAKLLWVEGGKKGEEGQNWVEGG